MSPKPHAGEHLYAVAVREGSELWLTLWVKRSPNGEIFIFHPVADRCSQSLKKKKIKMWMPHTSYHHDGRFHMKSHDRKIVEQKRQPLTSDFRGIEHLGMYGGHTPKSFGTICNPALFTGIVEIEPGILGPRHGWVGIDLIEPGHELPMYPMNHIDEQQVFDESTPHIVVTVAHCKRARWIQSSHKLFLC
jgi:hypothetical protein